MENKIPEIEIKTLIGKSLISNMRQLVECFKYYLEKEWVNNPNEFLDGIYQSMNNKLLFLTYTQNTNYTLRNFLEDNNLLDQFFTSLVIKIPENAIACRMAYDWRDELHLIPIEMVKEFNNACEIMENEFDYKWYQEVYKSKYLKYKLEGSLTSIILYTDPSKFT